MEDGKTSEADESFTIKRFLDEKKTHNEFNSDSEESQLSQHLEDSMLDFDEDLIKQRRIRTFSICESSDQESLSGRSPNCFPKTHRFTSELACNLLLFQDSRSKFQKKMDEN